MSPIPPIYPEGGAGARFDRTPPACPSIYPDGPGRAPFLLVGEAPNARMAGDARLKQFALLPDSSGRQHSANRLLNFTGWTWDGTDVDVSRGRNVYRRTFDRCNLLSECPPRAAKGRAFDVDAARASALQLLRALQGRRYLGLLVLGSRAARAFHWQDSPHDAAPMALARVTPLTWRYAGARLFGVGQSRTAVYSVPAAVVPHPSAINRWWNDAGNRERAREFFADVLSEAATVSSFGRVQSRALVERWRRSSGEGRP